MAAFVRSLSAALPKSRSLTGHICLKHIDAIPVKAFQVICCVSVPAHSSRLQQENRSWCVTQGAVVGMTDVLLPLTTWEPRHFCTWKGVNEWKESGMKNSVTSTCQGCSYKCCRMLDTKRRMLRKDSFYEQDLEYCSFICLAHIL